MKNHDLSSWSKKQLLGMLETMVRIRVFEEKTGQMYGLRKIGGFCHLYNGQEAVAVGAISALDLAKDYVLTGYRDHGHALAAGMDPNSIMAELYGKVTGCSRGKGGSMHLFDAKRHLLGGNGIVGAQIPIVGGVAFAQAYRQDGGVTLCFFGDGAIHQGAFHETLNMAKIWKLPLILICENNQWGMGTSWKKVSSVEDFSVMGASYGIPGLAVDGMDVLAVNRVVSEAAARARKEGLPTFIEARTYRYKGHSMSDPAKYRTREEVEAYKEQDPILIFKDVLEKAGILKAKEFETMESAAATMAQEAVDFAEASEQPALHTIYEDVYTDEGVRNG